MSREHIADEAIEILTRLRDNAKSGHSNKLADIKSAFEKVSLDFDTYFFFLRKYQLIAIDHESCLQLTSEGERVLDGERRERFSEMVDEYFAVPIDAAAEGTGAVKGLPAFEDMATLSRGVGEERAAPGAEVRGGKGLPGFEDLATLFQASGEERVAPEGADARGSKAPPGLEELATFFRGVGEERAAPGAEVHGSKGPPAFEDMATLFQGVGEERVAPRGDVRGEERVAPRGDVRGEERVVPREDVRGEELDKRYLKYEAIGSGPFGTVYRGRHLALGIDVAIKELKDLFGYFPFLQRRAVTERLKRAVCAQSMVRHPAVAAVLDQNCEASRPYTVVETCVCGSLRSRLEAACGNGLPPAEATRIFLQVCYGLRAAHQQGLLHGNLKPENILFDHLGNAKITDFGLRSVVEVEASQGLPPVIVGTAGMGYLPPELLGRSGEKQTPASDVYQVGMILYEMLTGRLPGRRSPLPSLVNPEAPSQLDPLFDSMTQDRREQRSPDFEAVLADFYAAFGGTYLQHDDLILSSKLRVQPLSGS